jgi:anti-sigma regulatory factor (Ser/Thr protein kinase)
MPTFVVPTGASLHAARSFLDRNNIFQPGRVATLRLNRRWMHLEPMALVVIAAWGAWCKRNGMPIRVQNLTRRADYAWRMGLFEHLGVDYNPQRQEHEEAGRFLPLTNVRTNDDARAVIADVSALLHLDRDPESLAAARHCISELLRNVLEHSASPDGAFVCAHNYSERDPRRVSLAVADCGVGIAEHLANVYPELRGKDERALVHSMLPGVTGAVRGPYGTSENAGAGLFITRSIAKGTGGYFLALSGGACYRLRRATQTDQAMLFPDPLLDRHDLWSIVPGWQGTVVAIEINTERINDIDGYFQWIRDNLPRRTGARDRIRFT